MAAARLQLVMIVSCCMVAGRRVGGRAVTRCIDFVISILVLFIYSYISHSKYLLRLIFVSNVHT